MAITYDNATSGGGATARGSTTFAFTVSAGVGRILWVGSAVYGGLVTGITYNGVAMTELSILTPDTLDVSWFYLLNPAVGSHNVVITYNQTLSNWAYTASSYLGVSSLGTKQEATANAAGIQVICTSKSGELVVDLAGRKGSGDVLTKGAGQTQRAQGTSGTGRACATSEEAGAASVTMSWTASGGTNYLTLCAVPMKPLIVGSRLRWFF